MQKILEKIMETKNLIFVVTIIILILLLHKNIKNNSQLKNINNIQNMNIEALLDTMTTLRKDSLTHTVAKKTLQIELDQLKHFNEKMHSEIEKLKKDNIKVSAGSNVSGKISGTSTKTVEKTEVIYVISEDKKSFTVPVYDSTDNFIFNTTVSGVINNFKEFDTLDVNIDYKANLNISVYSGIQTSGNIFKRQYTPVTVVKSNTKNLTITNVESFIEPHKDRKRLHIGPQLTVGVIYNPNNNHFNLGLGLGFGLTFK